MQKTAPETRRDCVFNKRYSYTYEKKKDNRIFVAPEISFLDGDLDPAELGGQFNIQFSGTFATELEIFVVGMASDEQIAASPTNATEILYPMCLASGIALDKVTPAVDEPPPDPNAAEKIFLQAGVQGVDECFVPLEQAINRTGFTLLLAPGFAENATDVEFRAVLRRNNTLQFASDIFRSTETVVDNYLNWTGLTYTDTNPDCEHIGGTLLFGIDANFELNTPASPLEHFAIYVTDWNSTEYKYFARTQNPVRVFADIDTNQHQYSHWAIFAVTPMGSHTHIELRRVYYDLGYQPKISGIRFPDADPIAGSVGGCVVWDTQPINTTCLLHHEIWFQDPSGADLQKLGTVNIGDTTFAIPRGTPMPVLASVSRWYEHSYVPHVVCFYTRSWVVDSSPVILEKSYRFGGWGWWGRRGYAAHRGSW